MARTRVAAALLATVLLLAGSACSGDDEGGDTTTTTEAKATTTDAATTSTAPADDGDGLALSEDEEAEFAEFLEGFQADLERSMTAEEAACVAEAFEATARSGAGQDEVRVAYEACGVTVPEVLAAQLEATLNGAGATEDASRCVADETRSHTYEELAARTDEEWNAAAEACGVDPALLEAGGG